MRTPFFLLLSEVNQHGPIQKNRFSNPPPMKVASWRILKGVRCVDYCVLCYLSYLLLSIVWIIYRNFTMKFSDLKTHFPNSLGSHVKFEPFVAGISGGVVATLALHPLDLLKTRLAADDGQIKTRPNYTSLRNAVSTILRNEGIKGFYKGVTPNCWGAGASWGLFFLFYEPIKSYMAYTDSNTKAVLGPSNYLVASAIAGFITTFLTNPIWVVKTRMCIQYQPSLSCNSVHSSVYYNSMVDALSKIYRHEGVFGLYKGFVPGMFGVSHGTLFFMAYEELKKLSNKCYQQPPDHKLSAMQYILVSSLSKLFAASFTYPLTVIGVRLQNQRKNCEGFIEVIKKVWKYEGLKGFYKGIVPNLIRLTPATAITLVVVENMPDLFSKFNKKV